MCDNNYDYTPEQVVADLEAIGIVGINPDFVTIVSAREETDETTGTSQMILVEIDQPFETQADLTAWGEQADQIERDNPTLANFFHNEWHGLVSKLDENDVRVVGKVGYIRGDHAAEIAREMYELSHNPIDALMRSLVSGAGLNGRQSPDAELAALMNMLAE